MKKNNIIVLVVTIILIISGYLLLNSFSETKETKSFVLAEKDIKVINLTVKENNEKLKLEVIKEYEDGKLKVEIINAEGNAIYTGTLTGSDELSFKEKLKQGNYELKIESIDYKGQVNVLMVKK